jgi:cytochrome c oxidase subunit II
MTATTEAASAGGSNRAHALRLAFIIVILSVIADLLIWFVLKPHLPPGDMSSSAQHQQSDIAVLAVTGAPFTIAVITYFLYSVITWRARGDQGDGVAVHGSTRVAATWIVFTSVTVMFAFVFGTVELIGPAGAGAGEGPSPIWKLTGTTSSTWTPGSNDILQVQAIGQQWTWTFRYPQFGGMETSSLFVPVNTPLEIHVTSLDVIHSFWAYNLGVKADANPGVDNVAYTTAQQKGDFLIRCNELCGIWHGAMFNQGQVMSTDDFQTWASHIQTSEQSDGLLAELPPYALTYDPTVLPGLTDKNNLNKVDGITGAAGYYYTSANPVTP